MTADALRRSASIHANHFSANFAAFLVALGTFQVQVHAAQHPSCAVVIETFPVPSHRNMTIRTILLRTAHELAGVSVLRGVASGALRGSIPKYRRRLSHATLFRRGRLVALDALQVPMRSIEPGFGCSGVLEWPHLFPLLGSGVAGFTGQRRLVWIGVTRVAGSRIEVVLAGHNGRGAIPDGRQGQRRAAHHKRFVALFAGYGGMPPNQRELRLRVPRDRKCWGLKARGRMAIVVFVGMRREDKLSAVAIGMAGGAGELGGNVYRLAALGLMAFSAAEFGMFSFQRERALTVCFAVKSSRFEAGHRVTRGAVRPGRARGELTFVRIFMAIAATLVRHGSAEIGAFVTFGARHFRVLSQ
jgi:hypothetical protein